MGGAEEVVEEGAGVGGGATDPLEGETDLLPFKGLPLLLLLLLVFLLLLLLLLLWLCLWLVVWLP